MDKRVFKSNILNLLKQDVMGLSDEEKIKYIKKWIWDYEREKQGTPKILIADNPMKIGSLVRTTFRKLVSSRSLSDEQITLLQNDRYCKMTFDINYPFLKKVMLGSSQSLQRKINGYDRYWEGEITINGERYFICNDWYERNRQKFISWVNNLSIGR